MTLINTYYESERTIAIKAAGEALKTKLLELKDAGTDQPTYTNAQVLAAVPEVAALVPLTGGEIHSLCEIAGVGYEQE